MNWKIFVEPYDANVQYKPSLDQLIKLNNSNNLSGNERQSLKQAFLYFNEFESSLKQNISISANSISALDPLAVHYHRHSYGQPLNRLVMLCDYLIINELVSLPLMEQQQLEAVRSFLTR